MFFVYVSHSIVTFINVIILTSLILFIGGLTMKKFNVKIVGVTPYLQHRMDDQKLEEWEKNRKFIVERDDISKEDLERAMFVSYSDENGFFIPSEHIRGSLINGAKSQKSKVGGATRSMKSVVAGMFFVYPEQIRCLDASQMVIDKRSAVNRIIKARVIAIRPKWKDWSANFQIWVDNDTITKETVRQILENAGRYVGIGSFRPEHNGMFGRFEIESFELAKE